MQTDITGLSCLAGQAMVCIAYWNLPVFKCCLNFSEDLVLQFWFYRLQQQPSLAFLLLGSSTPAFHKLKFLYLKDFPHQFIYTLPQRVSAMENIMCSTHNLLHPQKTTHLWVFSFFYHYSTSGMRFFLFSTDVSSPSRIRNKNKLLTFSQINRCSTDDQQLSEWMKNYTYLTLRRKGLRIMNCSVIVCSSQQDMSVCICS